MNRLIRVFVFLALVLASTLAVSVQQDLTADETSAAAASTTRDESPLLEEEEEGNPVSRASASIQRRARCLRRLSFFEIFKNMFQCGDEDEDDEDDEEQPSEPDEEQATEAPITTSPTTLMPTDSPITSGPTHSPSYKDPVYNDNISEETPSPIIDLRDGVALSGQTSNSMIGYKLEPIFTGDVVECFTSASDGDADLYLQFGEQPALYPNHRDNACSSFSANSNEACTTIPASETTTLYIIVHAFAAMEYTDLTIECSVERAVTPQPTPAPTPAPPPPGAPTIITLQNGVPRTNQQSNGMLKYVFGPVSEGAVVSCATIASDGDADMYLQFNREPKLYPNAQSNACSSFSANSNEFCTTTPASETSLVYITVHAFGNLAFSDLSIICSTDQPTPGPPGTPQPTPRPTPQPTPSTPRPTPRPTPQPTRSPTPAPTQRPTPRPSPAPTPAPTPESIISLQSGIPLSGQRSSSLLRYRLGAISTGDRVQCRTIANGGDADLYVKFGSQPNVYPNIQNNACSSISADSNEACLTGPASSSTTAFVIVHAYAALEFTNLVVTCSIISQTPAPTKAPTRPPTRAPTRPPTNPPANSPSSSSSASDRSQFSIALDLDLRGAGSRDVFDAAVAKWGQIITGDLPDFNGQLGGSSECGAWPSFVDDVYICGKYKGIDGIGGILGSAGPRAYRPDSGLPITGNMAFDAADIQAGTIRDLFGVIVHEMGHVLGIGSLWVINGLTNSYTRPCPYQSNSAASREYRALSGCSGSIPVEMATGRQGSDCGHWAENCFRSEVMTSAAGSTLPFSRLTIAGLDDLGYEVNYNAADPFAANQMNPQCRCNNRVRGRDLEEGEDGIFNIGGHERRLSDEGRDIALAYGREVLDQAREQLPLFPSPDYIDIGGDIVFIIYMEAGVIYSVMVTAAV